MKTIAILLISLFLTGCSYQVRTYHIEKATQLCKEHKGIFHIYLPDYEVRCIDGHLESLGTK